MTAIFFMKEVLDQFASNDTSLKQRGIPLTEFPTITFCLKHPSGIPYSYGTDFNVSLNSYDIDQTEMTNFRETIVEHDYEYEDEKYKTKFKFQEIYSPFVYNCYKFKEINLGGNLYTETGGYLMVKFNETFSMENLPNIEVIVTSEENSNGIIFSEWKDGVPLKFEFNRVKIRH